MPEPFLTWIEIVAWIAAICTTSVPVIYSFSPWRSRLIGKLIMLQAISFALLMDATMLGVIWRPTNIFVVFWIDAIVLTTIAGSTLSVAIFMARVNLFNRKENE